MYFSPFFVHFSQCIKVVKYLWRPNTSTSHLRAAKVSKNKGQAFKGFFEQTNFRIEKPQGKSWWHLLKFYTSKSYSNYGFKISGGQTGKIFDYNGSFSEISAENLLFPSIERISVSNLEQDSFISRNHNFFSGKSLWKVISGKKCHVSKKQKAYFSSFFEKLSIDLCKRNPFFFEKFVTSTIVTFSKISVFQILVTTLWNFSPQVSWLTKSLSTYFYNFICQS